MIKKPHIIFLLAITILILMIVIIKINQRDKLSCSFNDAFKDRLYLKEMHSDEKDYLIYSIDINLSDFNDTIFTELYDYLNSYLRTSSDYNDKKIQIMLQEVINTGHAYHPLYILSNYTNENKKNTFASLCIHEPLNGDNNNSINTEAIKKCKGLKEIKYLSFDKVIAESAKNDGIDWYKMFPELKEIEVME